MAEVDNARVVLILDNEEAGFLLSALSAHLGGTLTLDDQPLGRIRQALAVNGVRRLYPDADHDRALKQGYAVLNTPVDAPSFREPGNAYSEAARW